MCFPEQCGVTELGRAIETDEDQKLEVTFDGIFDERRLSRDYDLVMRRKRVPSYI